MLIRKNTDRTITLKLTTEKTYYDVVCSESLIWKDLSFHQAHEDGWNYIYDEHTGNVYPVNGYNWDSISKLLLKKKVTIKPGNKEDYKNYSMCNYKEE
jgi:hypothetical protein